MNTRENMKRKVFLLLIITILMSGVSVFGQSSLSAIGTATTQNFNTLTTSDFNLIDNISITGVYALRQNGNTNPNVFTANFGNSTAGSFYNYGTQGDNDRALGSLSSGAPGTLQYGVRFRNDTGVVINSLSVTYTGEQWRKSGSTNPQTLIFDYRQATTVTDLTTGTYTPVTTLNFITPTNTATGAAIDGNDSANRTTLNATIVVSIPSGGEIMLRWTDLDDSGNDHGIAIDDLIVTPQITTAAGTTVGGRVIQTNGNGIRNAQVKMLDSIGVERTAVTDGQGNYTFEAVPSGLVYVFSVAHLRYQFAEPTQVQFIGEETDGINFTGTSFTRFGDLWTVRSPLSKDQ